ncbi:hypothetical protein ACWD26_25430 [Streptomyces sp. NPDC002787]
MADHAVLGAALSDRFLGGLDPADGFHRQLALTAVAFLDTGRRLDRTAVVVAGNVAGQRGRERSQPVRRTTGDRLAKNSPSSDQERFKGRP